MAHAFKVIPAKPAFGTVRPLFYQNDYLNIKKRNALFVKPNINARTFDYESFYLLRYNRSLRNQVNQSNLIYNLYSVENLANINTVSTNSNTSIETSSVNPTNQPFYKYYTIDPNGQLFGRSQCGELNYFNYMQPNYCINRPSNGNLDA
jgi:hypothetical protein